MGKEAPACEPKVPILPFNLQSLIGHLQTCMYNSNCFVLNVTMHLKVLTVPILKKLSLVQF